MNKENINVLIIVIAGVLLFSFLNYYYEGKNIVFKKCLDVIPQENMLDIELFNVNVDNCKK